MIEIFFEPGIIRGARIARELLQGAHIIGRKAIMMTASEYAGKFNSYTVAFYGVHRGLRSIYDDAIASSTDLLFFDLGYWNLGQYVNGSLRRSYHRVGLNDRHPNAYLMQRDHPETRFSKLHLKPNFDRKKVGNDILLVGMGSKAAAFHNMVPGYWETSMVKAIRQYTDRQIVYRPKPSASRRSPSSIMGATVSVGCSIEQDLERAWCVVVHQSNAAVDALLAGVPVIVMSGGAAAEICSSDITLVDDPPMPDEATRRQFFNNLAYTQWTLIEMANGAFWRNAVEEGLIE